MNLEKSLRRPWWRTWRILLVASIIVAVAVIVTASVVAVHHKAKRPQLPQVPPKASILLPLYVYPTTSSAWKPLFKAVTQNPGLNFTVIINPDTGPGSVPHETEWAKSIKKLNSHDNVRTMGYIRTKYATRSLSDVLADVKSYSHWAKSSDISVDGIFFDEAPYIYSVATAKYMRTIDSVAKSADGILGNRTVIHNPGVIPDSRYNDTNLDITVVFEGTYNAWEERKANVFAMQNNRLKQSVMINSMPDMNQTALHSFVDSISSVAQYIFITRNSHKVYETFSHSWKDLPIAMTT